MVVVNQQRNSAYTEAYLEELKGEADYRATYVSRIKEEMAKNDAEKAEFLGTDDEDLYSAVADALNAWFAERLTEQTELAAETKAVYDEQKLQFDTQVERELEYAGIQFEWAKIREMEQDI